MRRFFNSETLADDSGNISGLKIENIPTATSSTPFGIIVSAIDSSGYPRKATAPISIGINKNAGSGQFSVVSGSQTIETGQYSAICDVRYTNPSGENGVRLQATASGLTTAISNNFNVNAEPPLAPNYFIRTGRSRTGFSFSWSMLDASVYALLVGKKATTIDIIENEAEWNNWNTADLALANLSWGSAPQLPNNEGVFMLYYSNATSANITGLTRNTAYSFALYSVRNTSNGKAMLNMNEIKLLNQVTLN